MSIIAKTIIDTKEYRQLKEIAAAYKAVLQQKEQGGSGLCLCKNGGNKSTSGETVELSKIVAENDRLNATNPPETEIIASITDPYSNIQESENPQLVSLDADEKFDLTPDDRLDFEEAIKQKEKWYFVGKNVRK